MSAPVIPIKASYTARIIRTGAIGTFFLLLTLAALASFLFVAPECSFSLKRAGACEARSSATHHWTVVEKGTYTLSTSGGAQSLKLLVKAGAVLDTKARPDAKPLKMSLPLAPGDYEIALAGKAGQSVTLEVERQGGTEAGNTFRNGSPLGVLPLLALALIFLGIPLLYLAELKKMPRGFDPEGVTMRNGTKHRWSDYLGMRLLLVVRQGGGTMEEGMELSFRSGPAAIKYRPITNLEEIAFILAALKENRNPFA